ncbi:MAG: hypothetical protein KF871_10880 [Hydrogenophaga sp.]|uniref:hypothetical protein n=1 Tax=Hydrogenophaga sp. TaxID=1904254 RepID=UPI001DB154A7|nr:hypothetical protein [Hydrogenophaga sp.]MBX3610386.1 hypothetical protein [Hydrogenophaga sp.]
MPQSVDAQAPSVNTAAMSAPNSATEPQADPLVKTWQARAKASEKHWSRFHKRVAHNRAVVQGISKEAEPTSAAYNKHRANLIASTVSVILSKVYAKNPEMSGEPTNKARPLRLFADTVSTVTQTMLEDAKLKQKAKRAVKAAMTCSFGVVKVQWQRDIREDPLIKQRIEDTQDNLQRIQALISELEDPQRLADEESKKRELEQALAGLEAQREVVAAEGLTLDMVRTERLLPDPAVEDIWDYASGDYLIEKIPMRRSKARSMFPDLAGEDGSNLLDRATTYKVGGDMSDDDKPGRGVYAGMGQGTDDPMVMVYEAWSKLDNTIYTFVNGIETRFARKPYQPERVGERWYPYFLLPFQSVDGEFVAQSLVDVLEKLQDEHNETRDKFAEVRKNIRPHFIASADVKDKDIKVRVHPELGEIIVVDTGGARLEDNIKQGTQLTIDPAVYDTSPIRNDWEMVSGLQDAARSVVVQPKTATEAAISDQSLAARVAEFRDQIEDWLTEIAQYASEVCLLSMTPAMVETIMGAPEPVEQPMMDTPMGPVPVPGAEPAPQPAPTYEWPDQATPETVFNLINMKIRAGSTAAPNKLQAQETWTRALPLIREMVMVIRQIDSSGGDSTAERELVRETAARFDETIDVDRFLPAKPAPMPAAPALPMGGAPAGPLPALPEIPGAAPGMPMPGGPDLAIPATLQ